MEKVNAFKVVSISPPSTLKSEGRLESYLGVKWLSNFGRVYAPGKLTKRHPNGGPLAAFPTLTDAAIMMVNEFPHPTSSDIIKNYGKWKAEIPFEVWHATVTISRDKVLWTRMGGYEQLDDLMDRPFNTIFCDDIMLVKRVEPEEFEKVLRSVIFNMDCGEK